MAPDVAEKKPPRAGTPLKGLADQSWPVCANCQGYGFITQELAIAGAKGTKGDPCSACNGVGRVADPAWPTCGCGGSDECVACHGLGRLSPEAQASLADRVTAAAGELEQAQARLEGLRAAASGGARRPRGARE